ncbi:hypothetical protein Y1Q_0014646 [Alligator mississippiensis]|uniref:Uncharacterized protein n=1 Tax=Alligator mississippiensis TaxID=8496 RepID=A0A151P875_ALLMI|nr:hypothetical protein Y1Q_0014646 [Alligator mississippiensis]
MRSGRQHRERSRRSNKKQKTKLQFEQRKRMGVTLGEDVELTCGMPEKRREESGRRHLACTFPFCTASLDRRAFKKQMDVKTDNQMSSYNQPEVSR